MYTVNGLEGQLVQLHIYKYFPLKLENDIF